MPNMEDLFNAPVGEETAVAPEVAGTDVKKGAKRKSPEKEAVEMAVRSAMKKSLQEDPNLIEKMQTRSDDIEVVNTLSFGTGGNIIVDPTSETRKLKTVAAICGYIFQNLGAEPIKYTTEVYHQDENGVYVGEVVEKAAMPGETFMLTRKYSTMLLARTEFSFTLKNGKFMRSSKKGVTSLDEELEAFHFSFNGDVDKSVNGDTVKLAIDEEGPDGVRVIKPEYTETFGYLANPKKAAGGKGRKTGAAKASISQQAYFANYIRAKMEEQGIQ